MKFMMYFWLFWAAWFGAKVLDYAIWKTFDNSFYWNVGLTLLYSYLCYNSAIKLEDENVEQY